MSNSFNQQNFTVGDTNGKTEESGNVLPVHTARRAAASSGRIRPAGPGSKAGPRAGAAGGAGLRARWIAHAVVGLEIISPEAVEIRRVAERGVGGVAGV